MNCEKGKAKCCLLIKTIYSAPDKRSGRAVVKALLVHIEDREFVCVYDFYDPCNYYGLMPQVL